MHSKDIMSKSCSSQGLTRPDPIRIDSRINYQMGDCVSPYSQVCMSPIMKTQGISDRNVMEEANFRGKVWVGRKEQLFNRRLFAQLKPDQLVADKNQQIFLIREQFTAIGIDVEIRSTRKNPLIYEIIFENSMVVQEVLLRSKYIKYKLSKHWIHRPRPAQPWKYKSLRTLLINSGRSVDGHVVGKVEEGETVEINQVKGKRGRIIRYKDNGELEIVGWVSLRASDGSLQLKQLNYL